jgi:uncharacterized protein with PIN domain
MNLCFAAEKTLGKLAKWLRILGFDTLYESDFPNSSLLDLSDPERILLTRTQIIREKISSPNLIFITSDHPFEQLKEVIEALDLKRTDTRPFSRCLRCNTPIEPIDKDSVRNDVPDYIWETHNAFQVCIKCRKIFWPGSHTKRSMNLIKELFEF